MTKEQPSTKIWTKDFITISVAYFFVFIVFYALLTTLPLYVIHELGESEARAGLVVTSMLIAAIIVRPFAPKLVEILGKKKILLLSLLLYTLTMGLYLLINNFIPLLFIRFLHGISFAVVTTVMSAIAVDVIPKERKGAGMGYFAMAMNLAVVIGPFIGLLIAQQLSFHMLFIVLTAVMLISLVTSLFLNVEEKERKQTDFSLSFHDLIEVKALPVGILSGLVGFAYASILSFVPIYAEEMGLAHVASYFFLVYAGLMLLTRPSLGRAFDEKGPKAVLIPCLGLFAFGLMLLGFTTTGFILLVSAALIGIGYGTLLPGFQTMAIQSTSHERSGHAIATFFIFFDIGISLGAYTWGVIVDRSGFETMYFIGSALVVATIFVYLALDARMRKKVKI